MKKLHFQAEISLCRVYKRAGIADHHLPGTISSKPSTSSRAMGAAKKQSHPETSIHSPAGESSSDKEKMGAASPAPPLLQTSTAYSAVDPVAAAPLSSTTTEEDATPFQQSKDMGDLLPPPCRLLNSFSSSMPAATVDELNRVVGYHHSYLPETPNQLSHLLLSQSQLPPLTSLPTSQSVFTDKIWEWNPSVPDSYTGFK